MLEMSRKMSFEIENWANQRRMKRQRKREIEGEGKGEKETKLAISDIESGLLKCQDETFLISILTSECKGFR